MKKLVAILILLAATARAGVNVGANVASVRIGTDAISSIRLGATEIWSGSYVFTNTFGMALWLSYTNVVAGRTNWIDSSPAGRIVQQTNPPWVPGTATVDGKLAFSFDPANSNNFTFAPAIMSDWTNMLVSIYFAKSAANSMGIGIGGSSGTTLYIPNWSTIGRFGVRRGLSTLVTRWTNASAGPIHLGILYSGADENKTISYFENGQLKASSTETGTPATAAFNCIGRYGSSFTEAYMHSGTIGDLRVWTNRGINTAEASNILSQVNQELGVW